MFVPVVQGVIRRRILVNFRVDPEVMRKQLPEPFRPKPLGDAALAGICLIRLEQVRPRRMPAALGLASENAAHRVAVVWTDGEGRRREGVYIPRRDSSSLINHLTGGRLFPGTHECARFEIQDSGDAIALEVRSADGSVSVRLRARPAAALPPTSAFPSLAAASAFFEEGSTGYSPRRHGATLDGLILRTWGWKVEPLAVDEVESSYFADPRRFPPGSVAFDCALLMRNIDHEWRLAPEVSGQDRRRRG
jgi:uncharacterized protein YqjF (DUF2071 family)